MAGVVVVAGVGSVPVGLVLFVERRLVELGR
jgi:hypothetical protein